VSQRAGVAQVAVRPRRLAAWLDHAVCPLLPARTARAGRSSAGLHCQRRRRYGIAHHLFEPAQTSPRSSRFAHPFRQSAGWGGRERIQPPGHGWRCRMRATSVEPVNITPITCAASANQCGAHPRAVAGQQMKHIGGQAGLVPTAARPRRRSAGSARPAWPARGCRRPARRHLAGEDGQRKVPGADAGHRAHRDVGGVVEGALHLGWRSSAKSPLLHAPPSRRWLALLPASRASAGPAGAACALPAASAVRSSAAARSAGGVAAQRGCGGLRRGPGRLVHIGDGWPLAPWPTTSLWSAGLRTGWVRRLQGRQPATCRGIAVPGVGGGGLQRGGQFASACFRSTNPARVN
jgi:hypothetical protein